MGIVMIGRVIKKAGGDEKSITMLRESRSHQSVTYPIKTIMDNRQETPVLNYFTIIPVSFHFPRVTPLYLLAEGWPGMWKLP